MDLIPFIREIIHTKFNFSLELSLIYKTIGEITTDGKVSRIKMLHQWYQMN